MVAVRLPAGSFISIPVDGACSDGDNAAAWVIKDGGDDPDVTHGLEFRVRVKCRIFSKEQIDAPDVEIPRGHADSFSDAGILLIGGEGVGVVTKPGLPVRVGEPAVNPVPREMLSRNLVEELLIWDLSGIGAIGEGKVDRPAGRPWAFIPFSSEEERLHGVSLEVEIQVPRGKDVAHRTLNPRLGIRGGISILGTTGIVKPFSHKAYEETIQSALSVAASNGCSGVVLSTGGKSERFAREVLGGWPPEAFVQIADFYAFAVKEAFKSGFEEIVHSVFFGKALKMAQGHAYTHAHKVPLDLGPLASLAAGLGHDNAFCRALAGANTARHALEMIKMRRASGIVPSVAGQALKQSVHLVNGKMRVRILLFDYDGTLLADSRFDGAF